MPEQDQRPARLAHGRQPAGQIVEEIVPCSDVDAPAAGQPVAANVEGVDVEPRLGQQPSGALVAAAVLPDSMDDEDRRPRRAGGRRR